MRGLRRLQGRDERGQVLVMSVMFLAVLLGAAALTLDIGRMAANRRHLQNGVDAAALAGAFRLPSAPGGAQSDALSWATNNSLTGAEVTEATVFNTSFSNDTIRVSAARPVSYIFGRAVGMNSQTITATAAARVFVLNGIIVGKTRAFPYGVWGGNKSGVKMGDTVTFRSNSYEQANVDDNVNCTKKVGGLPPPNCTWDMQNNNFKGYFHWANYYKLYVKETLQAFSQGGNAFGTDDAEAMWPLYLSGTPVMLPVIDISKNPSGQELDFRIPTFVCVKITQMDKTGSIDWKGTIVQCAGDGLNDGPTPPTMNSAFTIKLVQ